MDYLEYLPNLDIPPSFLIVLLLMLLFLSIVMFVASILSVIGKWTMFKKAGKDGWAAIIPIYDLVVLCQISGVNPWWIVILIVSRLAGGVFPILGFSLAVITSIYFKIILYVSIARSYGKSDAYAIGIYFLRPFFFFALGVGSSRYQGANPLKDPVLEAVGINPQTESTVEKDENTICKNCGEQNLKSSKFCTSCGKELK